MPRPVPDPTCRPLLAALAAAAVLTGCGGGQGGNADAQVAARVNKGEITIHQVQSILQRDSRQSAGAPTEASTARVLEVLIDQEIAAQAARDQGLDNDPRTVQALEAARREILALSYQQQVANKAGGPGSNEIDQYYDNHPALFAQRRLYTFQEVSVDPASINLEQLRVIVERSTNAEQLVDNLRGAHGRLVVRQFAHAAEDLPLTLLEPLAKLEPGQSYIATGAGAPRVFTLRQALPAPIGRQEANNAIAAYILTERRNALVLEAMKTLRAQAKIEYRGNFAKAASAAQGR